MKLVGNKDDVGNMSTCKKKNEILNVKRKKSIYYKKQYIECVVKDVKIYIYWVKKKDLFGCFRIEEIRDKDNATGLKEGGGIEMSTTVLSIYAIARSSFAFEYLP